MAELVTVGDMLVETTREGYELTLRGYWGVQEVIPDLNEEGQTTITIVRIKA